MVGQRLGRDDPQAAEYCTWTGLHLAALYMGAMALGYLAVPKLFLAPFGHRAHDAYFDGGLYLLWSFVCAYICIMGVAFYFRFRTGRWKSMRVIERDDDTPH